MNDEIDKLQSKGHFLQENFTNSWHLAPTLMEYYRFPLTSVKFIEIVKDIGASHSTMNIDINSDCH